MSIQSYTRPQTSEVVAVKAPKLNTPTCEDGGREFHLTLSERLHTQAHCGSCGTRFTTREGATKLLFPKHNIPASVHEYRQKLEKDGVRD